LQRLQDRLGSGAAVKRADGLFNVAVAHQGDSDIGLLAALDDIDVEPTDLAADIGNNFCNLTAAVGLGTAVDIDSDRDVVFADAVRPTGHMKFGAEDDPEKSVNDLLVSESLFFGSSVFCNLGMLCAGMRSRRNQCQSNCKQRNGQLAHASYRAPVSGGSEKDV